MSKKEKQGQEVNFLVKGLVRFAGIERGDKTKSVLTLKLSDERAAELETGLGIKPEEFDGVPIKQSEEDGSIFFKASTIYPVDIYENAEISEDISLGDIGEDSEVEIMVSIKESTYKRKSYQVAYLKSVNILDLKEAEHFNPYAKGADIKSV